MDVLVAEDDALVSLEEALAFIDGYDIHDQSLTETLAPVHSPPLDVYHQITPSELLTPKAVKPATTSTPKRAKPRRKSSESSSSQDEKPTKKRRTRSAASSSTRLQQRKRAEIQALREQAQELEMQVQLLRKNKLLPGDVVLKLETDLMTDDDGALMITSSSQIAPSNWHEMAIEQYRERLISEKTNRRLKSILTNQEKVNGSLSDLLQKRSVVNGMEYVFSTQPSAEASILCGETSTASMSEKGSQKEFEELEAVVQRIFSESRSTFTTTAQAPAISCEVRIKHDAKRGKIVEFITTTPMCCSVEEASDILWKELTTYHDYPDKVYKRMITSKPSTHQKNFVMNMRTPSGLLELNRLQYMQKFDELEHTVFVVAERMVLPTTKGCLFRDEGWMNVTQSKSEPGVSVVELLVQFYMERDDRIDVSPENLSYAQNVVMGSLSNTFLRCFQAQQNALMEKAGPITAKALQKSSVIV